jgi:hypothetical protein
MYFTELAGFNFHNMIFNLLIQAIRVDAEIVLLGASDFGAHFANNQCNGLFRGVFEKNWRFDGLANNALVAFLDAGDLKALGS